jgi:hypothetical protein
MDRLARERQPQREQVALGADPRQIDPQVREVDLSLRARLVGLRDARLLQRLPSRREDLRPAFRHVVPNGRVRQLSQVVFVDQPGQDPAGGVTLLARSRQVIGQHRVDQGLRRVQLRSRPDRHLALRWHRVAHRLPDRPAVHPVLVGQRPDRQLLQPLITPDRLVQIHLRPRHFLPLPIAASNTTSLRGGARSDRHNRTPACRPWGQIRPSRWGQVRVTGPGQQRLAGLLTVRCSAIAGTAPSKPTPAIHGRR